MKFLLYYCLSIITFFSALSVGAQNTTIVEKQRKLFLYPLLNETGRAELNYISTTITKLVSSRIQTTFVYDYPQKEFEVRLKKEKAKQAQIDKSAIPVLVEALELNQET